MAINTSNSKVYQDPLLTNVSVRYTNKKLIAETLFPIVTVEKRTGVYFVYNKENLRAPQSTLRADMSRAQRTSWDVTKTTYGPLLEHSLEIGLDKDDLDEAAAPLDLRIDAALTVTEKVLLEKEQNLATYLNSTTNLTQNITKSGIGQWNDYANSTPFTDVQGYRSTMIGQTVFPNTMAMGQQVWDQLKNHPDLLERIKYTQMGVVTEALLATLFEVDNVVIGSSVVNSAVDGQTDSVGFVWPKSAWLMYCTPQPGIRTVSAGYFLTLQGGRYIDRWAEQERKAEFVRFNDYYQPKVIAQEAMYLIKNAVA